MMMMMIITMVQLDFPLCYTHNGDASTQDDDDDDDNNNNNNNNNKHCNFRRQKYD
jgi:hypothetical protein